MLATNHVLAGASIGLVVGNPLVGFVAGVASHIVMDSIPHWGADATKPGWERRLLRLARVDGLLLLLVGAVAALSVEPSMRGAVVAGAFGALLLDLDKPFDHFFGRFVNHRPLWGHAFARFNVWLQPESPSRWWVEAVAAVTLTVLFIALR